MADEQRRVAVAPGDYLVITAIGLFAADLSGERALRIEKAFGVKMETLMRMQSAFDIAKTRSRQKEIRVRRFHPRAEAHP